MDMNSVLKLAAKVFKSIDHFSACENSDGSWTIEVTGLGDDGYVLDYAGWGKSFGYAVRDIKKYLNYRIKTGKDLPER
jgi:hypothetical protein